MAWDITADMRRFDEAIAAFRRRVVLTAEQVRVLGSRARQQGFWVAGTAQLDVVRSVFDRLDAAIRDGTPFGKFKQGIADVLKNAWGAANPARVETIARNAVQKAYNAGRHHQMREPAVLLFRPYWMFDAVLDTRTSPVCRPLDDTVLPADSSFWSTHTPPLHHRCRSGIRALRAAEAQRRGIAAAPPLGEADKGFGAAPSDAPWRPDLRGVDPVLAQELQRKAQGANDNAKPSRSRLVPRPQLVPPGGGGGGPRKPPPWWIDGEDRPHGKLDESEKRFDAHERSLAQYLAHQGNDVKAVRESTQKGEQRWDALINPQRIGVDHRTEFKRVQNPNTESMRNRIRPSVGQGRNLVMDVRGTGAPESVVLEFVRARRGSLARRFDYARFIGDNFDVTFEL